MFTAKQFRVYRKAYTKQIWLRRSCPPWRKLLQIERFANLFSFGKTCTTHGASRWAGQAFQSLCIFVRLSPINTRLFQSKNKINDMARCVYTIAHLWKMVFQSEMCLRFAAVNRNRFSKGFGVSPSGESGFPKDLVLPPVGKVVFQKIWCFPQRGKWFSKRFSASPSGESGFPKGLVLPPVGKVVFQRFWCFPQWGKRFSKRFGVSPSGERGFPKDLVLPPVGKAVFQKIRCFPQWGKRFSKGFGASPSGESGFPNGFSLSSIRKRIFFLKKSLQFFSFLKSILLLLEY